MNAKIKSKNKVPDGQRNTRILMLILILVLVGSVVFTTGVIILKTSTLLFGQEVNKNSAGTITLNIVNPENP